MRKRTVPGTGIAGPVAAVARLRARYQLTLPEAVATALSARPDDRLLFEADPIEPGVVRLRKARTTWAGAARGAFGSEDEMLAYLRDERASWGS